MLSALYQRNWKKENPDKVRAQNRRYQKRVQARRKIDPEFDLKIRAQRQKARKKNKYEHKIRNLILVRLGNKCSNPACQWLNADGSRGCTDPRCLQIDYVNGGGKQELKSMSRHRYLRKVLADVNGLYQLLCANCNWIKRFENQEV